MAKTPERRRLDALLKKIDRVFREAFGEYVRTVRSPKIIAQITEALEKNDMRAAEDIIRAHIVRMGQAVPAAFQVAGVDAASEATRIMQDNAIAFAFDPTHPRAAEIMRRERLGFIKQVTDWQLESVRSAIAEGFDQGAGAAAKARRIKEAIGLTRHQLAAVDNYREMLRSGSAEALDRELRDRRFDGRVDQAAIRYDPKTRSYNRRGKPLTADEVNRMVARYHERFIASRAETIARTESTRATSMAREETFRQLADQPRIGHNRIVRVWNSTLDGRVRDFHATMHGQQKPIGQAFIDGKGNRLMFPGDPSAPAETVINCRCVLTLQLLSENP